MYSQSVSGFAARVLLVKVIDSVPLFGDGSAPFTPAVIELTTGMLGTPLGVNRSVPESTIALEPAVLVATTETW
jgi:hypothetical protein